MSYTITPIETAPPGTVTNEPNQFNLPSKVFTGYDPNGTTTITGSERIKPEPTADSQQPGINVESKAPTEAPKQEEVALSPKITALARKEQAIRQEKLALVKREQELAQKLADADKYAQLKAKFAAKDYSAAKELGINYEDFLKHETDELSKTNPEEQRVRKVEEELASLKKYQEEKEVADYKANQALWADEIAKVVKDNPEFSSIKELGAESAVLQHVNDSFEEDDIELTVEQAAKDVEEFLVKRAEKFSSISKLKSAERKVLGAPKVSGQTITQNMTVTSQKQAAKPFHLLSEAEQIAEAYRRVQAAKIEQR